MAGLTGLPTHGPDYGPDWPLGNTACNWLTGASAEPFRHEDAPPPPHLTLPRLVPTFVCCDLRARGSGSAKPGPETPQTRRERLQGNNFSLVGYLGGAQSNGEPTVGPSDVNPCLPDGNGHVLAMISLPPATVTGHNRLVDFPQA